MPIALPDEARTLNGPRYDESTILRRYGRHIGYWSFYLKTGGARTRPSRSNPPSASPPRRRRTSRIAAAAARA